MTLEARKCVPGSCYRAPPRQNELRIRHGRRHHCTAVPAKLGAFIASSGKFNGGTNYSSGQSHHYGIGMQFGYPHAMRASETKVCDTHHRRQLPLCLSNLFDLAVIPDQRLLSSRLTPRDTLPAPAHSESTSSQACECLSSLGMPVGTRLRGPPTGVVRANIDQSLST